VWGGVGMGVGVRAVVSSRVGGWSDGLEQKNTKIFRNRVCVCV